MSEDINKKLTYDELEEKYEQAIRSQSGTSKTNTELQEELKQIKSAQSGSDRKTAELLAENQQLRDELSAADIAIGDNILIMKRLQNLEKAYDRKVEKLELDTYALRECLKSGVSYDLIAEIPFPDRLAVDDKISQLTVVLSNAKIDAINAELNKSHKPKTGGFQSDKKVSLADKFEMELTGAAKKEQEIFKNIQ